MKWRLGRCLLIFCRLATFYVHCLPLPETVWDSTFLALYKFWKLMSHCGQWRSNYPSKRSCLEDDCISPWEVEQTALSDRSSEVTATSTNHVSHKWTRLICKAFNCKLIPSLRWESRGPVMASAFFWFEVQCSVEQSMHSPKTNTFQNNYPPPLHVLAVCDPVTPHFSNSDAMGEAAPNLPRLGTPKRGRKLELSLQNLAESPVAITPSSANGSDRRQRRRTISGSPPQEGSSTSPFPDAQSSHAYENFLVYLPNATFVDVRVDGAILTNLSVRTFVELVQTYNEQRQNSDPMAKKELREIQWGKDVYIEDFEGNTVDDGEFITLRDENKAGRGLLLYVSQLASHLGFRSCQALFAEVLCQCYMLMVSFS